MCSQGLFCNLFWFLKKICLKLTYPLLARDCESVSGLQPINSSIPSFLSKECKTCKSEQKITKCRKTSSSSKGLFFAQPSSSFIFLALVSFSETISHVSLWDFFCSLLMCGYFCDLAIQQNCGLHSSKGHWYHDRSLISLPVVPVVPSTCWGPEADWAI